MENKITVKAPELEVIDGKVMTTSRVVAEYFGKRHDNVLQSIQRLECSEDFARLNFQGSKYRDPNNRERDLFHMTKDGFTFLVMGFTGKLAAEFKEAYINEFNRMQDEQANKALPFWDQASIPPHDKFLEKMVVEAGRGNRYAKSILELKYELPPRPPVKVKCTECGSIINAEAAIIPQIY
ncbi:Rha family transcriptional regulator [Vibrio sp. PP-XX7]